MDPVMLGAGGIGFVLCCLIAYQIYQSKSGTPGTLPTAADVGSLVKDKINAVVADVTGVADDIDATALDFSTRALLRHYLKHVGAEGAAEVTATFQTLLNINAKLPAAKSA